MNDLSQGSNRSTIIEEENYSWLHMKSSTRQMLERLARSADPSEEESSEDDDSSFDYDRRPLSELFRSSVQPAAKLPDGPVIGGRLIGGGVIGRTTQGAT